MKILECNHNLFSGPFLDLKKQIYSIRQRLDSAIYAEEKFINGFEKLAHAQLPSLIKGHNDLVSLLNLKCLKVNHTQYNSGARYS